MTVVNETILKKWQETLEKLEREIYVYPDAYGTNEYEALDELYDKVKECIDIVRAIH